MVYHPNIEATWALIKKPLDYPEMPEPYKIESIWRANYHSLYHRLSPYADYDTTLIKGFTKEPYYYTYIDESDKGLSALRKYDSRMFPIGSAPIDVVRVAKFLGSGRGIVFLGKQFLLQTGQAFNETRIYNPTSPIIAAGMGLALGTMRPQRNFDTSAGLGGIARTLIGNAIPDALFGPPKINPPFGTVAGALPDVMIGVGGKGLIRAGTAERGLAHLQAAWAPSGKLTSTFGSVAKNMFKSLFANFIPKTQSGVKARSDEGAYDLMVAAGATKFKYVTAKGDEVPYSQKWIAGKTSYVKNPNPQISNTYSEYVKVSNQYITKRTKKDDIEQTNADLKKSLANIQKAGGIDGLIYKVNVPKESSVVRSGNSAKSGYDRLYSIAPEEARSRGKSPYNYPLGVLESYRNIHMVDYDVAASPRLSKGFPTNGQFDTINRLTVLDSKGDRDFYGAFEVNALSLDKDGNRVSEGIRGKSTWQPYHDDQIALFFYDVVNEKYIPFRSAIKSLAESSNVSWEELQFIGRGDKVYSYGGFNRSLTFNIHVVISSLSELAPTWQRVNYLATLTKPSNYTTSTFAGAMNRFMVPPMVMLTLGDLYKDQPILIQSVGIAIPDDATWETQNEFNAEEWHYLADHIKAPNLVYGQLPRELDIALSLILLEKERAVTGGANFGHAPRDETWSDWNTATVPNGQSPNKFHKSLVVNVIQQAVVPPPPAAPTPGSPLTPSEAVLSNIPQYEPETPEGPKPFRLLSTEPNIPVPNTTGGSRTNNIAPIKVAPALSKPRVPEINPFGRSLTP